MNCGAYRGVKLLEHAMKIVEKVLERRMKGMMKVERCSLLLCQAKEQQMQCSFSGGYKRSTSTRRGSCICALLTWRRHFTQS